MRWPSPRYPAVKDLQHLILLALTTGNSTSGVGGASAKAFAAAGRFFLEIPALAFRGPGIAALEVESVVRCGGGVRPVQAESDNSKGGRGARR